MNSEEAMTFGNSIRNAALVAIEKRIAELSTDDTDAIGKLIMIELSRIKTSIIIDTGDRIFAKMQEVKE